MSALDAVYHSYKPIPTRKSFQIILEVPEERAGEVFRILGIPNSSTSIWVAVARLEKEPEQQSEA